MMNDDSRPIFFLARIPSFVWLAMVAAMTGIMLLWGTQELSAKWFVIFVMGISCPWIVLFFKNNEALLLCLLGCTLPIAVDIHLTYSKGVASSRGLFFSSTDFILIGLYAIWCLKILRIPPDKREVRLIPAIAVPVFLLAGWCILTSFFAANPMFSVYELVTFMKMILLYMYLANQVRSENQLVMVGSGLCLGVLMQLPIVMVQYFMGSTLGFSLLGETEHSLVAHSDVARAGGTLGHPNGLAFYLGLILPMVIPFCFIEKPKWFKYLAWCTAGSGLFMLLLTFSRTAWISAAVWLPLLVYFCVRKKWGAGRALMILIIIAIVLLIMCTPFLEQIYMRLFAPDEGRGYSRVPLMKVAWNMIKHNPILGVGLNNYINVMAEYDNTLERITVGLFKVPVHNVYLLMAAEIGIPGLGLFLLLVLVLMKLGAKIYQQGSGIESYGALGIVFMFISFLIMSLANFKYITANDTMWIAIGLMSAFACWKRGKGQS